MQDYIVIEKNITIPEIDKHSLKGVSKGSKYDFLSRLEIGDSVSINGNTPNYKPGAFLSSRSYFKKRYKRDFEVRVLEGSYSKPTKVRIWRTK